MSRCRFFNEVAGWRLLFLQILHNFQKQINANHVLHHISIMLEQYR